MNRSKINCFSVVLIVVGCFAVSIAMAQTTVVLSDGRSQATMSFKHCGELRTCELKSNAVLRDNQPANKPVPFSETADHAVLRSGNAMFDGLYAMAIHEARKNSFRKSRMVPVATGRPSSWMPFRSAKAGSMCGRAIWRIRCIWRWPVSIGSATARGAYAFAASHLGG